MVGWCWAFYFARNEVTVRVVVFGGGGEGEKKKKKTRKNNNKKRRGQLCFVV